MYKFLSPVTSNAMEDEIAVFWVDASSLCTMGMEIPKFQNVPGVTSYESILEVLRFSNNIFCFQRIVITLSHHKYHINIRLLPGNFQSATCMLLIAYLV